MKQNRSRCQLLGEINEVSFAVNDLHLYLDTHPLTIDSADLTDCDRWKWMEQPFPWEKEGACR